MGLRKEIQKRLSKMNGRLRREGRRLASVVLCGVMVAGNLSAVPVSALADSDSDNEYTYEIEGTALQQALLEAVAEGYTVNEDLEFAGEHAEEYAQLLEADGTLYELDLPENEDDEDEDRDKALSLRVFARIEGTIPVDEGYEIDGSEEIVFLVSNRTGETVTATISVDGLETDAITILSVDVIAVEEESTAVESAALTTTVSSGVSAGGSGGGGSSGSVSSTVTVTAETEADEDEVVITITDAADDEETGTDEITEDTSVTVVEKENSDESISMEEDDAEVSDQAEDADASEEEVADGQTEDTQSEETNTSDTDTADSEIEDADTTGDSDADTVGAGDDDTKDSSGAEDADSVAGSDAGSEESDENDSESSDGGNNDENNSSDGAGNDTSSDITEDSEVSVLGSAISVHNSILLAAGKATTSDAEETASASDADNAIDGIVYESVRFDKKGAAAFATTAADLKLDEIETEESTETVEYTAEADGIAVTVTASEGSLPENAVLSVTVYEEDSDEYAAAAEAIDYTVEDTAEVISDENTEETASEKSTEDTSSASTGLAVLDISFLVDGEEVEPTEAVSVSIDASGIVPEDADTSTIEVQHLTESGDGLEATLVADVEDQSDGTVDADNVVAEFEVESFSTFTITWSSTGPDNKEETKELDITVYVDEDEYTGTIDNKSLSSGGSVNLKTLLSSDDYTFSYAIVVYDSGTTNEATAISYTKNGPNGTYTITTSGSSISSVSRITSVDVYYVSNGPSVTISAEETDTGYTLTADPSNFSGENEEIEYTWTVDDGDLAEISESGSTATLTWADDVSAGDSVTVTVTATYTYEDEDGEEVTETATETYTITYGVIEVTITVYSGTDSTTTQSGASVSLYDKDGNFVTTGTTGSDGKVTFTVAAGTYTVVASYVNGRTGYGNGDGDEVTFSTDNTAASVYIDTDTSYGIADHVDLKVNGTLTITINGVPVELTTYVYSGSISVTTPDGQDLGSSGTVQESDGEEYDYEYRISAEVSRQWDSDDGVALFTLSGYVLISKDAIDALVENGTLTESQVAALFGTAEYYDAVTYNNITIVSEGYYYKVEFDDYHPTENVCTMPQTENARGYDFVLDIDKALSWLEDVLMVTKYVVDEDGKIIDDDQEFNFILEGVTVNYSNSTTLKSGESDTFEDLTAGGYQVTEESVDGYIPVTVTTNSDESTSVKESGYVQYVTSTTKNEEEIASVTYYNMKLTTKGVVELKKEVVEGEESSYSDDTFTFYLYTGNDTDGYELISDLGAIEVTTSESSTFYLAEGEYTIVEIGSSDNSQTVSIGDTTLTRCVAGDDDPYGLDVGTVYYVGTITVTATKTIEYTVTNTYTSGVELPETGGPGTVPFRIAGLLLASCSAYLIYKVLKRREEWMKF